MSNEQLPDKIYGNYEEYLSHNLPVLADAELRKKMSKNSIDFGNFLAGRAAEKVAARFATQGRIRASIPL